jgi:hypothetical protein
MDCAKCHDRIYEEWRSSAHAYASISPMFNKFKQRIISGRHGQGFLHALPFHGQHVEGGEVHTFRCGTELKSLAEWRLVSPAPEQRQHDQVEKQRRDRQHHHPTTHPQRSNHQGATPNHKRRQEQYFLMMRGPRMCPRRKEAPGSWLGGRKESTAASLVHRVVNEAVVSCSAFCLRLCSRDRLNCACACQRSTPALTRGRGNCSVAAEPDKSLQLCWCPGLMCP